jgi:hypothetical protein
LTWDHVPPQSSIDLSPVEVQYWAGHFDNKSRQILRYHVLEGADKDGLKFRHTSQNGLKFRTLCSNCNNTLLGARYDPELIYVGDELRTAVGLIFESTLELPFELKIPVRTHLFLRSVIDHLLAAPGTKNQQEPMPGFESGFYHELREYFLNEDLPIPPRIRAYYWAYPPGMHVAISALGIQHRETGRFLWGDLLKFFPLAAYIVEHAPNSVELNVPFITGDGCNDLGCTVELYFRLDAIPASDWPEKATRDFNVLMPLETAHVAVPKAKLRNL